MTLSSYQMSQFIAECEVGPAALNAAKLAILDTLAVMTAGSVEQVVTKLAREVSPQGPAGGPALLARGQKLKAEDAALLYGTAAHALDYDDVCMLAICHPSAPVLSALLAAAPWDAISGEALTEAFSVGTEVTVRLGQAIGYRHYALGFHSTATLGVFGAVAAIARLRRLDVDTIHACLAMTASMASGLRLNFGSDVKPLHVGLAAANALRAVSWSMAGITSSRSDLFAPAGLLAVMSGQERRDWPDDLALGAPFAIHDPGFEQKRFPGCYLLHKAMAIGLGIHAKAIALSQIRRIEVIMPRGATAPLVHPLPDNGKEAMFSLPYALLAAINDGVIGLSTFTDEGVARADLRDRLRDVEVFETGDAFETSDEMAAAPVEVRLHLRDGTISEFRRENAPGSPKDPLTPDQIRAKWSDCLRQAEPSLTAAETDDAFSIASAGLQSGMLAHWLPTLWRATSLDRSEKSIA